MLHKFIHMCIQDIMYKIFVRFTYHFLTDQNIYQLVSLPCAWLLLYSWYRTSVSSHILSSKHKYVPQFCNNKENTCFFLNQREILFFTLFLQYINNDYFSRLKLQRIARLVRFSFLSRIYFSFHLLFCTLT